MKYEYKENHEITYTETDKSLKLGLIGAMSLAQNMVTKYFQTFNSDNKVTKEEDNAVWVITKNNATFNRFPDWTEKIKCYSHTTVRKIARVDIETVFTDENNNILFTTMQESCPIDIETRKIRKISTVTYPDDMEVSNPVVNSEYSKLTEEFNKEDLRYIHTVRASDLDYSNHTNNVNYIKMIMNSINSDFWNDKKITNFQIYYLKESKESENIEVYSKIIEDSKVEFLLKIEDKEIVRARIEYEK